MKTIIKIKLLISFVNTIGIENLNRGNIKKMIEKGFDSIYKILSITKEQLLSLPGFKEKLKSKNI